MTRTKKWGFGILMGALLWVGWGGHGQGSGGASPQAGQIVYQYRQTTEWNAVQQWGLDGWELVAVSEHAAPTQTKQQTFYLKRRPK